MTHSHTILIANDSESSIVLPHVNISNYGNVDFTFSIKKSETVCSQDSIENCALFKNTSTSVRDIDPEQNHVAPGAIQLPNPQLQWHSTELYPLQKNWTTNVSMLRSMRAGLELIKRIRFQLCRQRGETEQWPQLALKGKVHSSWIHLRCKLNRISWIWQKAIQLW